VEGKRSDVIPRPDFGRGGNGGNGVSCNAYRHETKRTNTTPISNTHDNNLSFLFKRLEQTPEANESISAAESG
jgi:hypothetical protein